MLVAQGFIPRRLTVALALASAAMAPQAWSQAGMLEEVVVTASKRQQTLQEIPIAVSVVTAEVIEQSQVLDIKDLQTLVPSLKVTQLQGSAQTNFIIRGFGNGANNAGIEPSVGVFIDGVYRSRVGSALADLPKLERIEVLRGPQSTLFGKNASAGVINVVTAKPDLAGFSGSVGATLGNYNQQIVRGDVTGPLSDNVAFSLFGSMNQRDGYFDNLELGTKQNEIDRWNFRGQLLWNPTDRLEMRFIADGESIDEVCCGVANIVDGPTGNAIRAVGGKIASEQPFSYQGFFDFDPQNKIDSSGMSLQLDYDFDSVTLTSISAYRTLEQVSNGDIDYTSARIVTPEGGNFNNTEIDTFTQELRLTSAGDGPLAWMVGAFYFTEEVDINGRFGYGADFRNYADLLVQGATGGALSVGLVEQIYGLPQGVSFGLNQGFASEDYTLDDETLSLFAQADYQLTDAMTLTVGANYTQSDKDVTLALDATDVWATLPFGGTPFEGLQALQFLPPVVGFPNSVEDGKSSDSNTSWTVRLAYDLSPNMNVYVGASTGFKATSWNLSRDSKPLASDIPGLVAAGLNTPNLVPGTRFADPEESMVFEIGLKGQWDTISTNIAIFSQEIDGFQSNIFDGVAFNLANAGTQSTDGVEFDMNWVPTDALRISFAATWLDPLYDDFQNALDPNGPADLSGERPSGIPEFSTVTSATYDFNLMGAMSYVRIEHVYEDEVQIVDNVPAEIASREINMFNASAGMSWNNGITINLWGRNLTEDEFLLSAFSPPAQAGSFAGYPTTPRTYGLTLKYSFE